MTSKKVQWAEKFTDESPMSSHHSSMTVKIERQPGVTLLPGTAACDQRLLRQRKFTSFYFRAFPFSTDGKRFDNLLTSKKIISKALMKQANATC